MKFYDFDLVLAGLSEVSDELAERLFVAGCDDGTPCSSEGQAWIGFRRQAESLEAAIRSAIADVQKAGCTVARVQIETESFSAPG